MKRIIASILFLHLLCVFPCYGEFDVVTHWLYKIGNGDHISEPIIFSILFTPEFIKHFEPLPKANSMGFLHCMGRIDEYYPYGWEQRGLAPNLSLVDAEVIEKVLARRTPVFNFYRHNKKLYPKNTPRRIYRFGSSVCYNIEDNEEAFNTWSYSIL